MSSQARKKIVSMHEENARLRADLAAAREEIKQCDRLRELQADDHEKAIAAANERIKQVETQRDNYFAICVERHQTIAQQAEALEACEKALDLASQVICFEGDAYHLLPPGMRADALAKIAALPKPEKTDGEE